MISAAEEGEEMIRETQREDVRGGIEPGMEETAVNVETDDLEGAPAELGMLWSVTAPTLNDEEGQRTQSTVRVLGEIIPQCEDVEVAALTQTTSEGTEMTRNKQDAEKRILNEGETANEDGREAKRRRTDGSHSSDRQMDIDPPAPEAETAAEADLLLPPIPPPQPVPPSSTLMHSENALPIVEGMKAVAASSPQFEDGKEEAGEGEEELDEQPQAKAKTKAKKPLVKEKDKEKKVAKKAATAKKPKPKTKVEEIKSESSKQRSTSLPASEPEGDTEWCICQPWRDDLEDTFMIGCDKDRQADDVEERLQAGRMRQGHLCDGYEIQHSHSTIASIPDKKTYTQLANTFTSFPTPPPVVQTTTHILPSSSIPADADTPDLPTLLATHLSELNAQIALLRKRQAILSVSIAQCESLAPVALTEEEAPMPKSKKRKPTGEKDDRPCGWDRQLVLDDEEVELWDEHQGLGEKCLKGKRRCERHQGWAQQSADTGRRKADESSRWQKTIAVSLEIELSILERTKEGIMKEQASMVKEEERRDSGLKARETFQLKLVARKAAAAAAS
ncbi:hypothetical protein P7C73_g3103, partial [Tremellales sp. Uapishka_1]